MVRKLGSSGTGVGFGVGVGVGVAAFVGAADGAGVAVVFPDGTVSDEEEVTVLSVLFFRMLSLPVSAVSSIEYGSVVLNKEAVCVSR